MTKTLPAAVVAVLLCAVAMGSSRLVSSQTGAQTAAKTGEWRHWGGDLASSKYSALDQINRANVKDLKIAWRWKANNFGPTTDANMEATPLMVGGVLYTTAGTRRAVVAIDAETGETLWMYRLDEGERGDLGPRAMNRGVEYWTDGRESRIIHITRGYRMVSLDAKTGLPDPKFGKGGIVDLYDDFDQPTPKDGTIGSSSPAVVVRNTIVVGGALLNGTAPQSKTNTKGYIRGYDVRTGKRTWIFHTIPLPGQFGHDTWLDGSAAYTGNTSVWSPFSADEELGYVYLPVEGATGDFYGGHRPGNNLFAGSLVALDATTGKRIWHHQLVHHDMWDYDLGSPPNLIDITVNGRAIRAVALVTKWSHLYVFDRVTGAPVWPVEERPVPKGDTPGEWYSPTQPFPTWPKPFDRFGLQDDDLIDFTPELKAEALAIARQYRTGPVFTPPSVPVPGVSLGTLQLPSNQGSALWQGASWDPETKMLYVPSVTHATNQALGPGGTRSEMRYVGGVAGTAAPAGTPPPADMRFGPGITNGPWGIGPQGLPLVKPPYGRITAYNMNTGDIVFQVANGETYDWMTTHPALKGVTIPKTGRADEGGIVVTKTLFFAGQGCGLFRRGGGGGPMFYAYDKATGDVVHQIELPAGTCGNPMTYLVNGRQFIAVAVGSRTAPAELVALALP
jgi:quinoprotein glucose dehydrogenase